MTLPTSPAAALREAADLIDGHPHLPVPYVTTSCNGNAHVAWQMNGVPPEDVESVALPILSAFFGPWRNWGRRDGDTVYLERMYGAMKLTIHVPRAALAADDLEGAA